MADDATLCCSALPRHADYGGLIGESSATRRLYEMIAKVGRSTARVLVLGETGTGKELVARCIHFAGLRREKEFIPVDCSALTPTLVESELFGHIKSAFTGAEHSKRGLLQAGHEGTIFLDEISELPIILRSKLLRVLQEKEIRPVGSTERTPIDVRVIAASNRNLEEGVRAGTFRQDLYFRLNVIQITVPTLRERRSDIPLLVAHFLERFSDRQQHVRTISLDALKRLKAYDWPGNVREVRYAIERAVALSSHTMLTVDDFDSRTGLPPSHVPDAREFVPLAELERRALALAVHEAGGNKLVAARLLGIGKTTLYRKLKKYAAVRVPMDKDGREA